MSIKSWFHKLITKNKIINKTLVNVVSSHPGPDSLEFHFKFDAATMVEDDGSISINICGFTMGSINDKAKMFMEQTDISVIKYAASAILDAASTSIKRLKPETFTVKTLPSPFDEVPIRPDKNNMN